MAGTSDLISTPNVATSKFAVLFPIALYAVGSNLK
jgi:hypothetical protein